MQQSDRFVTGVNEALGDGKSPLTVLSVAYPLMTVGKGQAGGAEEILRLIDAHLTGSGNRSIVIAGAGSQVEGELVSTPAMRAELADDERVHARQEQLRTIESVLATRHVDLLQFNGLDFLDYRPRHSPVPELATLHLPISWYPPDLFEQENVTFNFVSESQARSAPVRCEVPVIANGVDLEQLFVSPEKGNYLLWLGRICPEKGPHIALRVAHQLKRPLVLAGPLHSFAAHRDFYTEEVAPHLDSARTYIGPVSGARKSRLLSEAACLLVPSLAEETSSLVAMEAIASGTPVVAFGSGALPEVVDQEVTGYIVHSEEEMSSAINFAERLSPAECRAVAEKRFSGEKMSQQYLELYRTLVSRPKQRA